MILRWGRRVYRHNCLLVLIAVLSACGGGTSAIIAVIEIVTPLGGDWGAPLGNDDEDEYGDFPGVAVVGHDYPNFDRR